MATTQRNSKVSEQTVNDLSAKIGYVIGVDGEGDAHVHYPAADRVKIYDVSQAWEIGHAVPFKADLERDLDGRPLTHWMAYVKQDRGWTTTTHRAPEGNWTNGGDA